MYRRLLKVLMPFLPFCARAGRRQEHQDWPLGPARPSPAARPWTQPPRSRPRRPTTATRCPRCQAETCNRTRYRSEP